MKRIDLGHGAIALEPDGNADRVDAVPREFFERFKLSVESTDLYDSYRSTTQPNGGTAPGTTVPGAVPEEEQ